MQNAHAGFELADLGACVGDGLNGNGDCADDCPPGTIARGYVTIDSVNECTTLTALEVGYFVQGGNGVANNHNRLWGDFFYIDQTNNTLAANPMVHIEADASLGVGFGGPNADTGYTFYGRFFSTLGGFTGVDNREPLGSSWAVRYLNDADFSTDFVVWRDSTDDLISTGVGYDCGLCGDGFGPDWCPLGQTQVACFDESENVVELCTDQGCFPTEAQRIKSEDLAIPFSFGWCFLNLNHDCSSCFPGGAPWPPGGGDVAQSYVLQLHNSSQGYAGSLPAVELAGICEPSDITVPVAVFVDGFESGDTSSWN